MLKTNKSFSENMKDLNDNLSMTSDGRNSEAEEVDLPPDFFDDFSNKEFMDGLEIIDEVGKDKIDNDAEFQGSSDSENGKTIIKRQETNSSLNKSEFSKRDNRSKLVSHGRLSSEKLISKQRFRSPNRERYSSFKKQRNRNYDAERYRNTSNDLKSRYRRSRSPKKPTFLEELAQTFAAQGKSFPELDAVKSQGFSNNISSSSTSISAAPVYISTQQPTYDQNFFYSNPNHQQMNVFPSCSIDTNVPYYVGPQTCNSYPTTHHSNSYDSSYSFQPVLQYPVANNIQYQKPVTCVRTSENRFINNSVNLENEILLPKTQVSTTSVERCISPLHRPPINLAQTISRLTNKSSPLSQLKEEPTIFNGQLQGKRKVSLLLDNNIQMNKPKQQKLGLAELLEASLLAQSLEKKNTEMSKVDRALTMITKVVKRLNETQHSFYTPLTFDYTPTSILIPLNEELTIYNKDFKSTIGNIKPTQRSRLNIPFSFSSGEISKLYHKMNAKFLCEALGIKAKDISEWTRNNQATLLSLFNNHLMSQTILESITNSQECLKQQSTNTSSIMTQTIPGHWITGTKNIQTNQFTQTVIGIGLHTNIIDSLYKLNFDQLQAVHEFINMIQWTEPVTNPQINNLRNRLMSCYESARSGWQCPTFNQNEQNRNNLCDRSNINNDQINTNFNNSFNNNNNSNNPMSLILESLAYSSQTNSKISYSKY